MNIYLDNSSSTRVRKKVVEEMNKYHSIDFGNPGSQHKLGEKAFEAITSSRKFISKGINCKINEIIFTSGGTEANNLVLFGIGKNSNKKTIVISSIEHASVVEPCKELEKRGFKIIRIKVNKEGIIELDDLKRILESQKDVLLVSVMHVNNIIGTIQPIKEIGKICRKHKVFFHTDAVQSFGKIKIDVREMNIDLLSASAHKINGPKGVGFLYVKEGIKLEPILFGGGQENGIRSGTENVPGIAGFSKAFQLMKKLELENVKKIRDYFMEKLEEIGGKINGSKDSRIYNNIHVSFKGVSNSSLLWHLDNNGIYASVGSACDSKKEKDDMVLKEIGLSSDFINGSIRFSIDENVTKKDVDFVIKNIRSGINDLNIS